MTKTIVPALTLIAVLVVGLYIGKFFANSIPPWEPTATITDETTESQIVVAQGKVEPLGGIYSVFIPQGQVVSEYLKNSDGKTIVKGTRVSKNDELVKLSAHKLLEQQRELAEAKAMDAEKEIDAQIAAAKLALRAASLAKKEADLKLAQVKANQDQSINQKKLQNAKKKLDRLTRLSKDPDTKNLVSKQQIIDQQLEWENAKLELEKAMEQIKLAEEAAMFAVNAAQENIDDAKKAVADAEDLKSNPPQSLQAAMKLAETQLEISRIRAPISGEVIKVFVRPGETAINTPLLQIGNMQKMQCVAEVSDRMVGKLNVGDQAKISSPAFGESNVTGKVVAIDNLVGDSALPLPNPLAMVDKKTVKVTIEIDDEFTQVARDFIQLQVDVEIDFKK